MANEEQLGILKQGVDVWNKRRKENPKVEIDLRGVDLKGANLKGVDLSGANLRGADLSGAKLWGADFKQANLTIAYLIGADLIGAHFNGADLNGADLSEAKFWRAKLIGANLSGAKFKGADLKEANLSESNLREANLIEANLNGANLKEANLRKVNLRKANLSSAVLGDTIIAKIDLSQVYGLESIRHHFPSSIGTNTLQLSKGGISEVFLRGCGLSDWEIESAKLYKPGLSNQEIININYKIFDIRATQSIQISPLFISYSHADTPFVEKLEPHLTKKGIRFWRDTHDMKSGRMEKQVDHAMRQNPTVILILSENSTRSDWVEHEARLARDLEKELDRDVLCPIALDDSWKSAKWPARLMEQIKEYNILDYSNWQDDQAFGQVFNKMIAGLDMFYKV